MAALSQLKQDTAFQLRRDERLLMKVTSERIRNIIPAAIARLAIHVQTSSASFSTSSRSSGVMSTGLMFFSTSFGLTFFLLLGLLPVLSQNTPNPFVRRSVDRYLRIFPLWRLAHRVARYFRLSCSVASVYDDVLARGKRCTG